MQAENLSACARAWAIIAGLGAGPPFRSFWQARWAAWNCGERGSIPMDGLIWISPWELKSGNLGTPCVRMQAEKAMGLSCPDPPCWDDWLEGVGVGPTFATPGAGGLLEQAVTRRARPASAAAAGPARRSRVRGMVGIVGMSSSF